MDVFDGISSNDLGVLESSSIVQSGLYLIVLLGPIVLIGLAIAFAPKIIYLIRTNFLLNKYKTLEDLRKDDGSKYSKGFIKVLRKSLKDNNWNEIDFIRKSIKDDEREKFKWKNLW